MLDEYPLYRQMAKGRPTLFSRGAGLLNHHTIKGVDSAFLFQLFLPVGSDDPFLVKTIIKAVTLGLPQEIVEPV